LPDIGGDFHDYFSVSPQKICFVTGTVSRPKKNMSNIQTAMDILMTMNLLRSHFKAYSSYSSLEQCVSFLNNDLYSQNNGIFTVNIFFGVFDYDTGVLRYVSAGAPPHYLILHRNVFPIAVQNGVPLATKKNQDYSDFAGQNDLSNGGVLLVHTAGVFSRQNTISERYGEQRLKNIMSASSKSNPSASVFLEEIVKDITKFTEMQYVQADDYTLFSIKYEKEH
jgi:serine phosphatase RsbU (regulator of sigma subunit)